MQNENNNQPEIKVVGMLDISSHDHSRRVHDPDGLCPTLTAVAGGTHHIKIFDPTKYRTTVGSKLYQTVKDTSNSETL